MPHCSHAAGEQSVSKALVAEGRFGGGSVRFRLPDLVAAFRCRPWLAESGPIAARPRDDYRPTAPESGRPNCGVPEL